MESPPEELKGTVTNIKFRDDATGWTVFNLDEQKRFVTVTGCFQSIFQDEYVRLIGYFHDHKTFGSQFKSQRKLPHNTEKGISRYLVSRKISGIGPKTAQKIVAKFGNKTLEVMDTTPARLEEVSSIGKKKLRAIIKAWEIHRTDRAIDLFLLNNNLSPKLALKIQKVYGNRTIDILTKNPYRLAMDIKGIGFLLADQFAFSLGIAKDSKERASAAILHVLRKAEEFGHCYVDDLELIKKTCEVTQIEKATLLQILPECLIHLGRENYIVSIDQDNGSIHYLADLFNAEKEVARKVALLLKKPFKPDLAKLEALICHYCETEKISLSDEQKQAVRESCTSRIFILTGGPGVGKSTTANAIIKLLKSLGTEVALAAPTGRAAQRLKDLTGEKAKTIHRLLEWTPQKGFSKNEDQPLDAGAIIIDEVSMLDLRLAQSMLRAVKTDTQIIFLGDADQLPSVGPGNILKDMMSSEKVPSLRLTKIFRQAAKSEIIKSAHAINSGVVPDFLNSKESDCRFIEVADPTDCLEVLKKLVGSILPSKTSFHKVLDIQILTPMKKTTLGTDKLNIELQALLNPPGADKREFKKRDYALRSGDKVIQVSNNYDLSVFNGDIGYVVDAGVRGGKILVQYGQRTITYTENQAHDLQLAYAITIHKSQGSEFPVVIIPTSRQHYLMLQRNLYYTALTRAKKLAIFVGTQSALTQAIKTNKAEGRRTRLRTLLREQLS